MGSKGRGAEPARFAAVRQRFEQWRATRQGRGRIPERLWTPAVKLAVAYGLCRTARTLGLDYNALKKRVAPAGLNTSPAGPRARPKIRTSGAPAAGNLRSTPRVSKPRHQDPGTTFIELLPLDRSVAPECTIELEHPRGAKMRVRLGGTGVSPVSKQNLPQSIVGYQPPHLVEELPDADLLAPQPRDFGVATIHRQRRADGRDEEVRPANPLPPEEVQPLAGGTRGAAWRFAHAESTSPAPTPPTPP